MDVTDTTQPLFRRLKQARKDKGLTQSELAAQAGCTQSALSMMETGKVDAIARPTLEKVAEILGVPLGEDAAAKAPSASCFPSGSCCPNGDCPSNVPFVSGGELAFWPRRQPTPSGRYCAYCGEVLEHTCRKCGAPVTDGAFCPQCGEPRVLPPAELPADLAEWAARRRREIADWRSLL